MSLLIHMQFTVTSVLEAECDKQFTLHTDRRRLLLCVL